MQDFLQLIYNVVFGNNLTLLLLQRSQRQDNRLLEQFTVCTADGVRWILTKSATLMVSRP